MINFDQIELDCDINRIEIRAEKFAKYFDEPEEENFEYPIIYEAIVCNNKATEADDLPEEPRKGTRKPGDRESRRASTKKAKEHLALVSKKSDTVRINHNGAVIKEGSRDKFHKTWKRLIHKASRVNGKKEIEEDLKHMMLDQPEVAEDDKTFPEREDGCIDIDKFIEKEDDVVYVSEDDDCDDDDDWDEYNDCAYDDWYKYDDPFEDEDDDDDWDYEDSDGNYIERRVWNDDLHDHVYVREETELGKTRRELAQYKKFVDEFNLNTLYERWCADKEK